MFKSKWIKFYFFIFNLIVSPCFFFLAITIPKKRQKLIWGPIPILNNKYWSNAMKQAGYQSETIMSQFYSINRKEDYDRYFDDFIPEFLRNTLLGRALKPYLVFLYILRNASIVHLPFSGGPLGGTIMWRMEAWLFKLVGIKTILIPYGADAYMYSKVMDTSLRAGLLFSYPDAARKEKKNKISCGILGKTC